MSDTNETRSTLLPLGDGLELRYQRSRLLVEAGPDRGMEVVLGERPWVLGRGDEADLKLGDNAISRAHARLEPCPEGWRIVDLDSKGGTWIGGARIGSAVLTADSRFQLGETELVLRQEQTALSSEPSDEFHGLVSQSDALRRVFGMLAKLALLELPVLLIGESGTGKEGLAHAVHALSARAEEPYEIVDCTLLQGDHLRSELFGHVKGAFTGADQSRDGAFVRADGGTLLLDEVGELPWEIQAMLLRILEQGEVRPLGSDRSRKVQVRVLGATNRDLAAMVEEGTFRRDLYHRLSALEVRIPPLREREGDSVYLAEHFLPDGLRLSDSARATIATYDWPGNVRELRFAMTRAAALAEGDEVRPEDLGLERTSAPRLVPAIADEVPGTSGETPRTIEQWTEHAIREALHAHGDNRRKVASELGISRTTLYRHMKKMGLL